VALLPGRAGSRSTGAASPRIKSRSARVAFCFATVLRRTSFVDSSSALIDLWLRFSMAFDVDGGPVRIVMVWLVVESAPAALRAPGVFREN